MNLEIKNVQSFIFTNTPLFMIFNFLWAVSMVTFIMVLMGIANTMTTSVLERTREIGMAMAMGWRKSTVIGMVLFESSLIGFSGGIGGVEGRDPEQCLADGARAVWIEGAGRRVLGCAGDGARAQPLSG